MVDNKNKNDNKPATKQEVDAVVKEKAQKDAEMQKVIGLQTAKFVYGTELYELVKDAEVELPKGLVDNLKQLGGYVQD